MTGAEEEGKKTSGTYEFLQFLGGLRDGLLVLAGGLYILGYLTWSLYALDNNLGLLPAIDTQYFAAGIFPTTILFGIYLLVINSHHYLDRFRYLYERSGMSFERIFVNWIIVMVLISIAIWLVDDYLEGFLNEILFFLLIMLFFTTAASLLTLITSVDPIDESRKKRNPVYINLYLLVVFGMVGYTYINFFVYRYYPQIPQEVGGAKPRCAVLDIATDSISEETLDALTPDGIENSDVEVVRTDRLDVYFSSSNFMLVRKQPDNQSETPYLYQIMEKGITAITWCGEEPEQQPNETAVPGSE